jgi:nicotinamidase-related amidase
VSNPTLRVLADLPQLPVSLAESTLILIDCQNTYTRGVMELEGVQAALDEAAALLDRARTAGIPIIHIQHDDGPGSLYDIEGESGAIVSRVAPHNGEPVVVKNYPNSFVQTDLDDVLKTANASNLLLLGDSSVSAEAMQAASLAGLADLFAVVVPGASDIPG